MAVLGMATLPTGSIPERSLCRRRAGLALRPRWLLPVDGPVPITSQAPETSCRRPAGTLQEGQPGPWGMNVTVTPRPPRAETTPLALRGSEGVWMMEKAGKDTHNVKHRKPSAAFPKCDKSSIMYDPEALENPGSQVQPRIKRGHFLKVYRRVAAFHVLVTKASVQKMFVKTGTASQRSSGDFTGRGVGGGETRGLRGASPGRPAAGSWKPTPHPARRGCPC